MGRREQGAAMRARIYAAITALTLQHSRPPTNREIGQYLGGKSTGHIDYHLRIMRESGELAHTPRISRGIRVPQGCCAECRRKDAHIAKLEAALLAAQAL